MDIPGEKLQGVYQATEFLVRANVPPEMLPPDRRSKPLVGRRVAIIGGGDTAVDCARSSIRLGAEEVTIVYRRTEAEMPGNKVERGVSMDEGVAIRYFEAPVEFIGDDAGHVTAMKVIRMRLGEPDKSGRRSPVPVEGSEIRRTDRHRRTGCGLLARPVDGQHHTEPGNPQVGPDRGRRGDGRNDPRGRLCGG